MENITQELKNDIIEKRRTFYRFPSRPKCWSATRGRCGKVKIFSKTEIFQYIKNLVNAQGVSSCKKN